MPQYDAYEEPLALSPSLELEKGRDGVQTTTPAITIPSGVPPHQGPGNYKVTDHEANNDPFHSSMSSHTHARHASLAHIDSGTSYIIPATLTHPAALDLAEDLSAEEKASLAAYTKRQADEDSIHLILACERCGQDLAKQARKNDPKEFAKEAHMLNGGWMHRSRASCDLFAGHTAGDPKIGL